jgi:hypothetical protein
MWHKEEQGQVLWCFWKGPSIAHCDPDMAWKSSDCPCSCPTIRFCLPLCVCFSFQGRHPFLSFNFRWMLLRERRPFKSPLGTFPVAHVFNWKQVHRDFQTYFSYWARPYSEDSAHWPLSLIKRKRPESRVSKRKRMRWPKQRWAVHSSGLKEWHIFFQTSGAPLIVPKIKQQL